MDLIRVCFKSVIDAFEGWKFHFVIDKPNYEIMELIESCPYPYEIETVNVEGWQEGNFATYLKLLTIGKDLNEPMMLVEDDYYFLPQAGSRIAKALLECQFITPYDHPMYYIEEKHKYPREIKVIGDQHWGTIIDTTLTFGVQSGQLIKDNWDIFTGHSVWDEHIWKELRQYKLWSPIPSLATHMETEFLSPVIKWKFQ
jgi:hypothetical protein